MKKTLEIVLRTIHLGTARRVVTLGLDGKAPADEFLDKLQRSNPDGYSSLYARLRAVAEHDRYENKLTFRSLGDGLYEFKTRRSGLRLFAFYDVIDGLEPQLIIATSGSGKNKNQSPNIRQAREFRKTYLLRKQLPGTVIELKELES